MVHCDSSVVTNVTIMVMINRYEACHTGVLNSVHLLVRELMRGFPIINVILIIIISPYRFDSTELPKELIYGGSFKLTRLDDISVSVKQNMMSGDVDSIYYTYHRDLHSFDMYVTYKDSHKNNDNQWKIKFVGKDF